MGCALGSCHSRYGTEIDKTPKAPFVTRGFVLGRISDADHVPVDGAVQVGIRNPSPILPIPVGANFLMRWTAPAPGIDVP